MVSSASAKLSSCKTIITLLLFGLSFAAPVRGQSNNTNPGNPAILDAVNALQKSVASNTQQLNQILQDLSSIKGDVQSLDNGVILIDQSAAMAGNVTPGDAAGFPVTISRPGSYRLASNLVVPDANTTAIEVTADTHGVTIDLNGFSIQGPTVCSGFPLSCAPTGSGIGVQSDNSSRGVAVRNGTIIGMGSYGLYLPSSASTVEDVNAIWNGNGGILVELGVVQRNIVYKNGGVGIYGGNSVISSNNVIGNRFEGINVNDSVVTNNAMIVNGGLGLSAANAGFASNVFSSNNGGFANPQFSGPRAIGANICDGTVCP
jgi:hypothetical protein